MNLWTKLKCTLFGSCAPRQRDSSERLIDEMRRNVAVTTEIKDEIKSIRESGIWPQDLMRGTYRVNRRTVRHDQHS